MIKPFSIARLPRIEFGAGVIAKLPELIVHYGKRVLLVTGARSLQSSLHWEPLLAALREKSISW